MSSCRSIIFVKGDIFPGSCQDRESFRSVEMIFLSTSMFAKRPNDEGADDLLNSIIFFSFARNCRI